MLRLPLLASLLFLALTAFAAAPAGSPAPLAAPPELNDGWTVAAPGSVGLEEARFTAALAAAADRNRSRIDSLLVAQRGRLVFEKYFRNAAADKPHDLRSATKSITSLLVGIALDRGDLKSIDEPVASFFPDYVTRESQQHFRAITVRHLLTMSSGLAADDWNPKSPGNEERMYRTRDWLKFFFDLPADAAPGATYRYCTAGVVVLGEIVARASGLPLERFADEHLFSPLGIRDATWAKAPRGVIDSGGHLRLRSRDFLKIAQLMLQGGQWQGRQIVSREWVEASVRIAHFLPNAGPTGPATGYLWWLQPVREGRATSYQARGNGGQFLFVVPEFELVAAFTGEAFNDNERQMLPFIIMHEHVIPAARAATTSASSPLQP